MKESDIEKLEEYANLEDSDLGDMCQVLIRLYAYHDIYDIELKNEIIKEMQNSLNHFIAYSKIEEVTETRKYKILEWDS